jgi:hypothetical protein
MRARHNTLLCLLALAAVLGLGAPRASARVESEIAPPDKRRASVEKAVAISKQTKPDPLPATLSLPFAPPGFDLTDAEEAAAAAAANLKPTAETPRCRRRRPTTSSSPKSWTR